MSSFTTNEWNLTYMKQIIGYQIRKHDTIVHKYLVKQVG